MAATSPTTGLAPDRCSMTGQPQSDFRDDAWRVARNWAFDYVRTVFCYTMMAAAIVWGEGAHHTYLIIQTRSS